MASAPTEDSRPRHRRGRRRPHRQAARPARRGHRRRPHRRARAPVRARRDAARRAAGGSATPAARADRRPAPAGTSRALLVTLRGARPTAPPPRRARGIVLHATIRRRRVARGPRRVLRPPAGRPRGVRRRRHRRSARSPASCTAPPRTCSRCARPTAATALVPFVTALVPEVDVAGGRVVVADRPGLVAPLPDDDGLRPVRIDVVTIFPDYLAPLELSLPGKAPRQGAARRCASTTCGTGRHDRHRTVDDTPYGGGAGMVMKPEPWGEALDALVDDRRDRWSCARPRPARRSPRRWPASSPAASAWSSPADATRASTSGCSTTPRPAPRCARSRSATTCSTAARWPRWRSPRRSSGCCPASWATPSRWPRSPTTDGLLEYPVYTKPASLARPRRARRCCSPATTRAIAAWRHEQAVRRTAAAPSRPAAPRRAPLDDVEVARRRDRATPASCSPCSAPAGCRRRRPTPDVDIPRAARDARRRRRPGLREGHGRRRAQRGPAGRRGPWPPARRGGLGHRPADGRPGPAGPRPGPAAARHDRGGGAGRPRRRTSCSPGAGSRRNQRMYKKAGYRLTTGRRAPGVVRLTKRRPTA